MDDKNSMYNIKNFDFSLKKISEEGIFSGYASVFNIVDQQGDIVAPGAFKNCHFDKVKLLWQHNHEEPIGKIISIEEDSKGLFVTAKLLLEVRRAKEAYHLLKEGAIQGLSIGYTVEKYITSKVNTARILKLLNLWEISLVTFPSNTAATVIDIKSDGSIAKEIVQEIDRIIAFLEA